MSEKINHQRRCFLGIATMTIATTQLGRFTSAIAQSSKAQPKESATTQPGTAHTDTTAIRPFRINISKEALVNLRHRITATQWPEKETVTDLSQGLPLAIMQELARYWATDYDWRKVEIKLNTFPHFISSGCECLSLRGISGSEELNRAGLFQSHLLQPARQRWSLRDMEQPMIFSQERGRRSDRCPEPHIRFS